MGQVVYFSHGGGPLPILGDQSHKKMVQFMKDLPQRLVKPTAIVVFSAHWEERIIAVQSAEAPEMYYDYYGFPEEAYKIVYPCSGAPDLAKRIADLLSQNGLESKLDERRPYDHGSYIPLMLMYPEADIPVIQVSLCHNLNPETHLRMGEALRPLLDENILFIGSGFSFHNMRQFFMSDQKVEDPQNSSFQDALVEICCGAVKYMDRREQLINWESISGARYCHPREEHLLPLHVCVGLGEGIGEKIFDDYIIGKRATAYMWTK